MKALLLAAVMVAAAGSAHAGIPLVNATCPGGIEVHADKGGPIYINGKEGKLQTFNDNYYEARVGGVTVSLTIAGDGSPSLTYTGTRGANGVCKIATGARHSGQGSPQDKSRGAASTAKCSGSPQACFSAADHACRGSYQVVDSESHAGGIASDAVPGPVTWYAMRFRCGPSDGLMPSFAHIGPAYVPPSATKPGNKGGQSVRVADMQRYCQGEVAAKFDQRPQDIVTFPVEKRPNGGRVVYGQFPARGKNVKTFLCHFDQDGAFRSVERT